MSEDYLWDRSGQPDPEIQELEQQLGKYRACPRPMEFTTPAWPWFAMAAGILLAMYVGWNSLPVKQSDWTMESATLAMNRVVKIEKPTLVEVGQIGQLTFQAGSRFRIVESDSKQEVMELLAGSFQALILADPYVFRVITPAARLDDLGCAYEVSLNDQGNGKVAVTSGWVRVNGYEQESLVMRGYEVDLIRGQAPSIPRRIDAGTEQDVLRLVHELFREKRPEMRAKAFDQLAAVYPPPAGVTRERAFQGDPKIVSEYWPALNLGPEIALPRIFLGK